MNKCYDKFMKGLKLENYVLIPTLASIIYFIFWLINSGPFEIVSGDDLEWWEQIVGAEVFGFPKATFYSRFPVHEISLFIFKKIAVFFSGNNMYAFTILSLFSLSVTMVICAVIIFKLTKSYLAQTFFLISFFLSAWPLQYIFQYTYNTLGIMFFTLSIYLFLLVDGNRHGGKFIVLSGSAAGVLFWSSTFAPLMITLLFLMILAVSRKESLKRIGLFVFGAYLTASPFSLSLYTKANHLLGNIRGGHFEVPLRVLGYLPICYSLEKIYSGYSD